MVVKGTIVETEQENDAVETDTRSERKYDIFRALMIMIISIKYNVCWGAECG